MKGKAIYERLRTLAHQSEYPASIEISAHEFHAVREYLASRKMEAVLHILHPNRENMNIDGLAVLKREATR